jgi:Ca-activated chloride channel family protein
MRRITLVALALLVASCHYGPQGCSFPKKSLPPLAMVDHRVTVAIEDQVAITTVAQTFRNHTDRQLEATYLFPVPKGPRSISSSYDRGRQRGERRAIALRQGP